MNNHITLEQVESRLTENGLEYQVLDIEDGTKVVLSQHGGRIFGPFAGDSEESVLWLTGQFAEKGEFASFLESGEWNIGGIRVWIAPEHRFNMKDRHDLFGTYTLPGHVDPGIYVISSAENGYWLKEDAELPVYGPPSAAKRLNIERFIAPAADPLREMDTYNELTSGVTYAGFLHEVHLSEAENDGVPAELWDLSQINPGGNVYASVLGGDSHTDFYEPADAEHYKVFPHYARMKIDAQLMYKVGYKAPQFLGRVAYHNSLGDGTEYLFVRSFLSNPSATYTMEPPEIPGDRGYPIQVFNDNGHYGGFGEIECSGQAIGGETGRTSSIDSVCNWLYTGPRQQLANIARILIGAELVPIG